MTIMPTVIMKSHGRLVLIFLLLLTTGCVSLSHREHLTGQALQVTVYCGMEQVLRFNVSGRMDIRTQEILAGGCHLHTGGNNLVIRCPANGINWTQSTLDQIAAITVINYSAGPKP